jgi:cell division protein FtsW
MTQEAVRYRWRIGVPARALIVVTAILIAFGLATVFSASSIVALQQGRSGAYFFLKQLTGAAAGIVAFAIIAKLDAERWEKWAWPLMLISSCSARFWFCPSHRGS